jgi:hypothetical protein
MLFEIASLGIQSVSIHPTRTGLRQPEDRVSKAHWKNQGKVF